MKRNIYLDMVPDEEALETFIDGISPEHKTLSIPVRDALGYKSSKPIYANLSNPTYNSAAMDGIAVRSSDTQGATQANPITLSEEQYVFINTGEPIPKSFDSVIMIEDVQVEGKEAIIRASVPVFNHIRTVGEDIVYGEMIIPSNHILRPFDIAVLVAGGIKEIEVYYKPKVTIIPTGSEIIAEGSTPREGQILDSNSWMIKSRLTEIGAEPEVLNVVEDNPESLKLAIKDATANSDMVLMIAGSSAGSKDYTKTVIEDLGEVLIHGIAIKPGKPTILGIVEDTPIVGLPGYPVSCWISLNNYVLPVLKEHYPSTNYDSYGVVKAKAGRRMISSLRYKEYIRVKLGYVKGQLIASPLDRGAGSTMSLVRADGFAILPTHSEGVNPGDELEVELLRPLSEIEKTLVISGSHDLIIDEMADLANTSDIAVISSSHIGSLGGLMALARGEAHIAPTHLLDPKTGSYNDSYVKDIFDKDMAIISGVGRTQGLIVKKGNPLNIKNIEDIVGHKFVNRQRGSGTRLFTDYLLEQSGIDTNDIPGYQLERTTHMDIAASVNSDADVGIGVYSAAEAMDLDFIPLGEEKYEFVLYKESIDNPEIQDFISLLKSDQFKERVDSLGGYTTTDTGEIRYIKA